MMTEAQEPDNKGLTAVEIVIDVFYAVVIGVNVWIMVDNATEGALTTAAKVRVSRLRSRVTGTLAKRKEYRKDVGSVLFEAIDIVEGN